MKKIKQGKMDRKTFWITLAVVYFIIIMLAVNLETGDVLGDSGRIVVGIIAFVIYIVACVMRLRDAGKSTSLLWIVFIFPVYAYIIGCYKSEEPHNFEKPEEMKEDTWNMNREDKW